MNALEVPVPPHACDTHVHVFDAAAPKADSATKPLPPPATVDDYRRLQRRLGLQRVVFVQPTHYGLDNTVQMAAARRYGDDGRLVAVIDSATSDGDLDRLDAAGCIAVRLFLSSGGAVGLAELEAVAHRAATRDWHLELQVNGQRLPELGTRLGALPLPIVVAHIGRFVPPVPVDDPAFGVLLDLLAGGQVWVKLSSPYFHSVTGAPDYSDVGAQARYLANRFPERMLWASNWPHPNTSTPPDEAILLNLLFEWCGRDERRYARILDENPAALYWRDRGSA